jgi:hypothetical protein
MAAPKFLNPELAFAGHERQLDKDALTAWFRDHLVAV